jgi:ABC-2 type transport system permease protein
VLATYRERGILRRLATTPVRPVALLGAQLVMSLLTAIVSVALLLDRRPDAVRRAAAAALRRLRGRLPGHGGAGVFAIGLFIAALAPGGKAANTIGTLPSSRLMFFAGLWTPREVFPEFLQRIGDFTPLGAGGAGRCTRRWPDSGRAC